MKKYRLESQLQAAGLMESRFVSEKNKTGEDLKHVTANFAEERILWARDIAEKDRVLSHAKAVQEELERKAVAEAQKVRSKLSAEIGNFRVDTDFVSQVQERYQSLVVELEASNAKAQAKQAELEKGEDKLRELQQIRLAGLQGDRNWLVTNGLVGAFEYLRQSESFVTLFHRLSTTAYQSGHHDGVYQGYFNCQQMERITPAFLEKRGKLQEEMADALKAACNDPLPAYAELVEKVAEDVMDSLHQMLDMVEESGKE
ncbi:hypothetical protein Hanom_Chr13g01227911 [Helianthus anomalus]